MSLRTNGRDDAAILRAIAGSGDDGFFAVDAEARYTCFNARHAEAMRSLYGCEVELGHSIHEYQTVADDRDGARADFARVLRGERVVESAYSGDFLRDRRFFETTHDPVRDLSGAVVGVAVRARDVTELQRTREQLAIRARAVEYSINAIALADLDGLLTYVNPAFLALWGYADASEVVGRPAVDFWESSEAAAEIRADMLQTCGWTGELTARRKGGASFVVHLTTTLVGDDTGEPIGAMAAFLDVTDRISAEEAARATSHRLSLAQRAAGAGIWDWDFATGMLTWSPEFRELFGLQPDAEASFETWRATLHPDDLEAAEARITESVEQNAALENEYRIVRPDGEEVWIGAFGDTIYDESGSPLRMSGICLDIDARKRAESALVASERKWRSVLVHTPQIGVSLDHDAAIVFANRHLLKLTGYREEEVLGRNWFDLFVPESSRDEVRGLFASILDGVDDEGFSTGENPILTREGALRHVSWSNVVTRDVRGTLVDVTSLGVDITERKRAEEAIRTLNAELERRVRERTAQLSAANEELEAFAYSISHDLRGPLRAIDGFSEILMEDHAAALGANGRESLERVRAAAQKMGRLIDDLLSLSRLTRGGTSVADVDLSGLAAEVVERLREEHPERRVEVVIAAGCRVWSDAGLLEAVVGNLLGNAWKFTGGREQGHIEFAETRLDGARVFFVRDDGAGFDPAYAANLFQPFQRLHGPDEYPGTGIGLATVRRIVNRLGGRCWAEGAVDEGATFFFTLATPTD